jgi:hypothetical protein
MGELTHIYPLNDFREHEMKADCWCKPSIDEEDDLCIHNAMDQREQYETGERKPS